MGAAKNGNTSYSHHYKQAPVSKGGKQRGNCPRFLRYVVAYDQPGNISKHGVYRRLIRTQQFWRCPCCRVFRVGWCSQHHRSSDMHHAGLARFHNPGSNLSIPVVCLLSLVVLCNDSQRVLWMYVGLTGMDVSHTILGRGECCLILTWFPFVINDFL